MQIELEPLGSETRDLRVKPTVDPLVKDFLREVNLRAYRIYG